MKELVAADEDYLRTIVAEVVEAMLEYYQRSLVTWVRTLELRVPQDRDGLFSTRLFERYPRSEKALVAALAEMYVQDVSARKVKVITEELCGHSFSASAISQINKKLDAEPVSFAGRRAGRRKPSQPQLCRGAFGNLQVDRPL